MQSRRPHPGIGRTHQQLALRILRLHLVRSHSRFDGNPTSRLTFLPPTPRLLCYALSQPHSVCAPLNADSAFRAIPINPAIHTGIGGPRSTSSRGGPVKRERELHKAVTPSPRYRNLFTRASLQDPAQLVSISRQLHRCLKPNSVARNLHVPRPLRFRSIPDRLRRSRGDTQIREIRLFSGISPQPDGPVQIRTLQSIHHQARLV